MSKNCVLILSGYNNRAVIAFCRFCKENNIAFYIVAMPENDLIKETEYSKNIIEIRKTKELKFEDFLAYQNKIKEIKDVSDIVILPSTEFLNRFLLDNRSELEKNNFIVPLTNSKLYEEVSDKYSFCQLCEENGIRIPKEYKDINETSIPFVAKPKQYFVNGQITNEKPVLIMSKEDYDFFINEGRKDDFYYQEFVGGESFYLLYYFGKDKSYSSFSQQNLIQQDNGLSIIGAKSSNFHKRQKEDKYSKLFIDNDFIGLIMIEVKEYNNKTYMIEANPRLWGPSQLILDANMDLFHKFSLDFGLINKEQLHLSPYKENVTYFWSGGICIDIKNRNQTVFHQYDEKTFFDEYDSWIKNDIYLKNDTISVYLAEVKNKMKMKQKTVLSIGAGFPQIDFIKSLKDRGHYVVAIGKGRNSDEAINLCDEFIEVDTHNEEEVLNWVSNSSLKIDAVGSYSGGQAIRTLQVVNKALNLNTAIPTDLMVGMDKFSQQELYEKYKLSTIASWSIKEINENLGLIGVINKFIVKPAVGRGSTGVEIVNKEQLLLALQEDKYGEETIVQEFREGVEYRVLALIQDGELKLLAPVTRASFEGTVFLGRLSYDDKHTERIEKYFMNFIKTCGVKDVILKADILVSEHNIDMIEMDIGVGGGTYYKQYLSKLFNYDLNSEYINLITQEQVSAAKKPSEVWLMDYVYNLSKKPINVDLKEIENLLTPILGENKIIKNLLNPEKSGLFNSNAHFIITVIHKNKAVTNTELNNMLNEKLFKNG